MPVIVKLPRAKSDLVGIWDYIADDNEGHADAFVDRIDQKLLALASNPTMGRARDEFVKGLRSFPVGRYVIFYRPIPKDVEIVRVLHGSRDIDTLFPPEARVRFPRDRYCVANRINANPMDPGSPDNGLLWQCWGSP
jgi:toxin ParE1/3/4